jgi:hypothetical protein
MPEIIVIGSPGITGKDRCSNTYISKGIGNKWPVRWKF